MHLVLFILFVMILGKVSRWLLISKNGRLPMGRLCLLVASVLFVAAAFADEVTCGSLRNGFGPFDYRTATPDQRSTVEGPHFPLQVEALTRGATSVNIGHDLDFVLRAFPNHHRALMSMAKLSRRERRTKALGANYSVECYFDRAIRFQSDDPMPHMIAGVHFAQTGDRQTALTYLNRARELGDGDANLNYNLGLGYLEVGMTDKALDHAKRAYAADFPLPGLRDRLRAIGAWKE